MFNFEKNERRKTKLILPTPRIQMFKNSPEYRSIQIYNKLPESIRSTETLGIFKARLKLLLLKNATIVYRNT